MTTMAARIRNGSLFSEERNSAALPEKDVVDRVRQTDFLLRPAGWHRPPSPSELPGLQVEGKRDGGKLAFVDDGERRGDGRASGQTR